MTYIPQKKDGHIIIQSDKLSIIVKSNSEATDLITCARDMSLLNTSCSHFNFPIIARVNKQLRTSMHMFDRGKAQAYSNPVAMPPKGQPGQTRGNSFFHTSKDPKVSFSAIKNLFSDKPLSINPNIIHNNLRKCKHSLLLSIHPDMNQDHDENDYKQQLIANRVIRCFYNKMQNRLPAVFANHAIETSQRRRNSLTRNQLHSKKLLEINCIRS